MKKKLIYAAAVLIGMFTAGCDEMDQYPHNGVSPDNLTENDAQLLLTGLYNFCQYKPTNNGYIIGDMAGGDIVGGTSSNFTIPALIIQDRISPQGGMISGPWNGYYTGLYQFNTFIKSLRGMPATQSRNEMLGTACFFRGLYYYRLVTGWGAVPILDEPFNGAIASSPEEDVWAFVESNFQTAIDYCPSFSNKNYVSRQAAIAMMARTKLGQGKMAEAAKLAEQLIADSHFRLSDFYQTFNGGSQEEIFTFSNLEDENGIHLGALFYNRAHPNGGSYTFRPTDEVMNMFEENDNRKAASVITIDGSPMCNKFPGGELKTDPLIITRLAEMYLISAEAQGRSAGIGRLNELRAVRGLGPVSAASDEEYISLILDERRHELFGEGFRHFDLVRTGRYCQTVGVEERFKQFPIPERELTNNKLLVQNPLWATY